MERHGIVFAHGHNVEGHRCVVRQSSILEQLKRRILVSDGALGTELQNRGLPPGHCPEEFTLTHPEIVQQIHREYFEAGSDIVTTNSFGGNRFRLREFGFESQVTEICKRAVQLARQVRPSGKYIAGSIGPTGQILEPLGTTPIAEVQNTFREQVDALAEEGVDIFFIETMMAIEEAELAVMAAKERTGLPVAATMTFELGPKGFRTMWGVDIATAIQRLTDAGADIVGANCGKGFDEMVHIVKEMRALTTKPILAQPNAGLPHWGEGKAEYSETPESIIPKVQEILHNGANIVGGCCGTRPGHIRTIRQVVEKFLEKKGSGA